MKKPVDSGSILASLWFAKGEEFEQLCELVTQKSCYGKTGEIWRSLCGIGGELLPARESLRLLYSPLKISGIPIRNLWFLDSIGVLIRVSIPA